MRLHPFSRYLPFAFGWLAAVAVALIVWVIGFSPLALLRHVPASPEAMHLVPRHAVAAAAVTAPLPQLERLRRFRTKVGDRRQARREWDEAFSPAGLEPLASFLAAHRVDFQRDMQPWLGDDMVVALTDWPQSGVNPRTLMVFETADLDRSNFFLNLLWQRQQLQSHPAIESYKGVQILHLPATRSGHLPSLTEGDEAIAAVGDRYVVIASSALDLRAAIDAWQLPEQSLVGDPRYEVVSESLSRTPHFGIGYVVPRSSKTAASSPAVNSVGVAVGTSGQGLTFETAMHLSLDRQKAQRLTNAPLQAPQLLGRLPNSTVALLDGQDLGSTVGSLRPFLSMLLGIEPDEAIAAVLPNLGPNIEHSLLTLMGDEYTLALLPSAKKAASALKDDWVVVAEVASSNVASSLSQLDDRVRTLGFDTLALPLSRSEWGEAIAWIPAAQKAAVPQPTSMSSAYAPKSEAPVTGIPGNLKDLSLTADRSPAVAVAPTRPPVAVHYVRDNTLYLAPSMVVLERVLTSSSTSASFDWGTTAAALPGKHRESLYVQWSQLPQQWRRSLETTVPFRELTAGRRWPWREHPQSIAAVTTELELAAAGSLPVQSAPETVPAVQHGAFSVSWTRR